MQTRYIPKYKETVSDMNSEWSNLLKAFKVGDTRVEYLETFEQALALNCPSPLWENPRYFLITAKYPLPERGNVGKQKFKLYLMLYYYVMADAGLLMRESESGFDGGEYQYHAFEDDDE